MQHQNQLRKIMKTQDVNKNEIATTIGEMVAEDYRKAEVFKKFGIDFCCGGKKTLDTVCAEKGISIDEMNRSLDALEEEAQQPSQDFSNMELDYLADHIVDKHHRYIAGALPLLDEFSAKVAKVHGDSHPEVVEIERHYQTLSNELRTHMHKEEAILFPYIGQMAVCKRNGEPVPPSPFGTVKNPINMMETEHDSVGNNMKTIRDLSEDYTPPANACNTYKVLYAKLNEFDEDLNRHIHLENNILFPEAIKLEEELMT